MWAPADLFTPGVNAIALSSRNLMSYFYERPLVAVLVLVSIVAVLTMAGTLWTRTGGA